MNDSQSVTLGMSFAAGLLSFASPACSRSCRLSWGSSRGCRSRRCRETGKRAPALLYGLVRGGLFTGLRRLRRLGDGSWNALTHRAALRVAGAFIVALGLQFMGVFQVGFCSWTEAPPKVKPAGVLGSFFVVTRAGWTPCIGDPELRAHDGGFVIKRAAWSQLLAAYSAGFAVPFLAAAAALGLFIKTYRRFSKHVPKVVFGSGALLVVIGVMLMADWFAAIAEQLTAWVTL